MNCEAVKETNSLIEFKNSYNKFNGNFAPLSFVRKADLLYSEIEEVISRMEEKYSLMK